MQVGVDLRVVPSLVGPSARAFWLRSRWPLEVPMPSLPYNAVQTHKHSYSALLLYPLQTLNTFEDFYRPSPLSVP